MRGFGMDVVASEFGVLFAQLIGRRHQLIQQAVDLAQGGCRAFGVDAHRLAALNHRYQFVQITNRSRDDHRA